MGSKEKKKQKANHETETLRYLLEAQLGGAAAAGLLVGLELLLLIVQVPQHVPRVLLTPIIHPRIPGVHVRPLKTQQLLHQRGQGQKLSPIQTIKLRSRQLCIVCVWGGGAGVRGGGADLLDDFLQLSENQLGSLLCRAAVIHDLQCRLRQRPMRNKKSGVKVSTQKSCSLLSTKEAAVVMHLCHYTYLISAATLKLAT